MLYSLIDYTDIKGDRICYVFSNLVERGVNFLCEGERWGNIVIILQPFFPQNIYRTLFLKNRGKYFLYCPGEFVKNIINIDNIRKVCYLFGCPYKSILVYCRYCYLSIS